MVVPVLLFLVARLVQGVHPTVGYSFVAMVLLPPQQRLVILLQATMAVAMQFFLLVRLVQGAVLPVKHSTVEMVL
jgi:hypothetical protein